MSKLSNHKKLLGPSVFAAIAVIIATSTFGVNSGMALEGPALTAQRVEELKKGEFRKAASLKDLPADVKTALGDIADAGKPWASGCVGGPELKHVRFISAFVGDKQCWVFFESGGFAYYKKLALYSCGKAADGKSIMLWSMMISDPMETVESLRTFVEAQAAKKEGA